MANKQKRRYYAILSSSNKEGKKDTRIAKDNSKGGKKGAFQSNAVSIVSNASAGAMWLIYLGV